MAHSTPYPDRMFLSPNDALYRPPVRCRSNENDRFGTGYDPMDKFGTSPLVATLLPLPTKTTPGAERITASVSSDAQIRDVWKEPLKEKISSWKRPSEASFGWENFHQERAPEQIQGRRSLDQSRNFSEQDIKTRLARASLLSVQSHRATVSYPIYSPITLAKYSSPPYLPWGVVPPKMDPPRLYTRSPSAASTSITSRSSFESRHKSPLSISSSIDYESSRTSQDTSYSGSQASSKTEFILTKKIIPPTAFPENRVVNEAVPMRTRYGAGGEGRQQATSQETRKPSLISMISSGKAYAPRGEGFKKLPEEILLVILAELKKSHLGLGSLSCATCCMRDLINLGLSCKKWWRAAKCVLYEDIQLIGCDSILHTKKKFKIKFGTRLRLLRRTLRSQPELAEYVKVLKVPAMPEAAKGKGDQEEYMDLVATLIMACPNLERLPGFYPTYNHQFTRFVHALSTRRKLTENVWVINPSPFQRQRRFNLSADAEYLTPVLAPSPLLPEQCIDFMIHHSNWTQLKTLFLHCNPGGTIDSPLFTDVFFSLPSLEILHISSFPSDSFNDETLLSLPPLKSLRLDNLPGITANGLSSYGSPTRTDSLTSLSLVGLPLLSLPVLTRLFSHLKSLTHFTISQGPAPSLPRGTDIFLHPYLASPTLQYLHWEFTDSEDSKATEILSKAILYNGFPSLRTIRAPTDHDGTLQALCKPRERIELPADRYRNMSLTNMPHSQSAPTIGTTMSMNGQPPVASPTRSTFSLGKESRPPSVNSSFIKSPTKSTFSLNLEKEKSNPASSYSHSSTSFGETRELGMSLTTARRMAQHRIDSASRQPRFHIILWDPQGQFVERHAIAGFLGNVESRIFYSLRPDVEGSDEAVVGVEGAGGLLDGGEEVGVRDGCTGSWNLDLGSRNGGGGGKGKKDRERWWHTERGRWREVPLEKFF